MRSHSTHAHAHTPSCIPHLTLVLPPMETGVAVAVTVMAHMDHVHMTHARGLPSRSVPPQHDRPAVVALPHSVVLDSDVRHHGLERCTNMEMGKQSANEIMYNNRTAYVCIGSSPLHQNQRILTHSLTHSLTHRRRWSSQSSHARPLPGPQRCHRYYTTCHG